MPVDPLAMPKLPKAGVMTPVSGLRANPSPTAAASLQAMKPVKPVNPLKLATPQGVVRPLR
jgi:hypothetical protein